MGADPNIHDSYDGASALIYAAGIENDTVNQINYLNLLLNHGANPNDEEVGKRRDGNSTRNTPLLVACSDVNQFKSPMDKVNTLVIAGANVNYKNEFNDFPLAEALIHKHYDVVLYLLNNGANYLEMIFDRSEFSADGKKIYIADFLREELLSLDSKEYKQKMEVVEFLKRKGIDYRKIKIPSFVIDEAKKIYPKNWKEYLEKY